MRRPHLIPIYLAVMLSLLLSIAGIAHADVTAKVGANVHGGKDGTAQLAWDIGKPAGFELSAAATGGRADDNAALGLDYVWIVGDTLKLAVGPAYWLKDLNGGRQWNVHIQVGLFAPKGAFGWRRARAGIFWDHWSNCRSICNRTEVEHNTPLDVLSLGVVY